MLQKIQKHAVVMGGSMAGLLTARILSDHFDTVTILERDPVQNKPESRKGQLHTRHLHGILASGFSVMSRYYPALRDALEEGGSKIMDMGETMHWYTCGGYRQPFHLGQEGVTVSRPFLEHLIRQQTLARSNITLLDNCAAAGLKLSVDGQRVMGVEIEERQHGRQTRTIDTALVVDCSGRGSRLPQWLRSLGYDVPAESEVKVNVGYATRVYKRPPEDPRGQKWLLITPDAPRETRFGGLFAIEGDRWIVSMGGWHGDHCPTDEKTFLEFAQALPAPDIFEIISQAEPLTDIIAHKYPSSLRRHYEKLSRFPTGLLALGDAICSFNPTYGQGMSSAALQAEALDKLLIKRQGQLEGLAQLFFKQAAKVVDIPWQLAVGEDFRFVETSGPKPTGVHFINRYVSQVNRASHTDAVVGKAFLDVMNLQAPPPSLMRPYIMWRVWRANSQRPSQLPMTVQPAKPVVIKRA